MKPQMRGPGRTVGRPRRGGRSRALFAILCLPLSACHSLHACLGTFLGRYEHHASRKWRSCQPPQRAALCMQQELKVKVLLARLCLCSPRVCPASSARAPCLAVWKFDPPTPSPWVPLQEDLKKKQRAERFGLQVPLSKEEFEAKKAARAARFGSTATAATGAAGGAAAAGGKAEPLSEEQKKKLEERAKRWGWVLLRWLAGPAEVVGWLAGWLAGRYASQELVKQPWREICVDCIVCVPWQEEGRFAQVWGMRVSRLLSLLCSSAVN